MLRLDDRAEPPTVAKNALHDTIHEIAAAQQVDTVAGPPDADVHAVPRLSGSLMRLGTLCATPCILSKPKVCLGVFFWEECRPTSKEHDDFSLHGIGGDLMDDVARVGCFRWTVDDLSSGACARHGDTQEGYIGLYEDSACADVAVEMTTIRYVLDRVLARSTFYSTDSLQDSIGAP